MEHTIELTIEPGDTLQDRPVVLTPERWTPDVSLREDGKYNLLLKCPTALGEPVLDLQGYRLDDPTLVSGIEDISVWRWDHDETLFRNCFGLTVLRIQFDGDISFEFPPVEVLARKLKAEEARRMLEFIWGASPQLLYACFARTGFGAKHGEAPPSIERILKHGDELLRPIERLVYSAHNRARTRLVEETVVKTLTPGDVIDDRAVNFAMHHLDYATENPSSSTIAIPIRYRQLHFDRLAVVRKVESTDVYEHGVIHGVLQHVERRLVSVQNRLQSVADDIQALMSDRHNPERDMDYARFRVVCGYYIHQVTQRPFQRVTDMLRRVRRCQHHAKRNIPAVPVRTRPRLTPTFSTKPHYRPIFREVLAWYKAGDGLAIPEDLVLGLKTLDRLYEYVCLLSVLQTLRAEGWELVDTQTSISSEDSLLQDQLADVYLLNHPRLGQLELRYEPSIPPAGTGTDLWGLVKVTGNATDPFRPDFLLRFDRGASGTPIIVALDAKYSTFGVMRHRYLPETVIKYLHGVAVKAHPYEVAIEQLWLLGPIDQLRWDYQHQGRSINMRPTIGLLQVRPGSELESIRQWYRQVILPVLS